MGTKMGPSIACLSMGYFEELLFSQFDGNCPICYKRYIDDIVGAAVGPTIELQNFIDFVSNFYPFLKFTHVISTSSVNFLDLKLSITDCKISSNIYFKPTDSHNYLLYSSNHPPSCLNSIPYSQLLRAKRICSNHSDFAEASKQILGFFEARGYPSNTTTKASNRISNIDRNSALKPKSKSKHTDRIPLVLPFHPSIHPIRRIIYKHYKTLLSDPSTKDIFTNLPITAYSREKNISDHLVRAAHPLPPTSLNPGTYPCERKRCNTCPFVTRDQLTKVEGPSSTFQITNHFTCISANVIYIIRCKNCRILYVGETKRRLADRITEHLRSIKKNFIGFPIAAHFNPPSHCKIDHFSVTAAISCRGSNYERLVAENRLIFSLGTLIPKGLNSKFDLI